MFFEGLIFNKQDGKGLLLLKSIGRCAIDGLEDEEGNLQRRNQWQSA